MWWSMQKVTRRPECWWNIEQMSRLGRNLIRLRNNGTAHCGQRLGEMRLIIDCASIGCAQGCLRWL
jgi:hypothetical protein